MKDLSNATNSAPGYEQFVAFYQANAQAFFQSSTILADGLQELSKELLSEAKETFDNSIKKAKSPLSPSSMKEFIEQSIDGTLSRYQRLAATSAKLAQLSWKVASDTLAPVAARIADAADSLTNGQKEAVAAIAKQRTAA